MRNAREEFLEHIANKSEIVCAKVVYQEDLYCDDSDEWKFKETKYFLKFNYTPEDYEKFLDELNFEYDAGFGAQELFGIIWYAEGSWSERYEYDGSERWDYKKLPVIPKELI